MKLLWIIAVTMLMSAMALAQVPMTGAGKGAPGGGGGGGYSGPGDVVSGALLWYSCSRAYNAADTANACNVCLPADSTCADLTITSGFAVVPGSLSTCNITTVICTVKTMYDKTGNGRDVTQATIASRPTFRPAMASNGCPTTALPCLKFVKSNNQQLVYATGITQAQPITMSMVYINASFGEILSSSGGISTSSTTNAVQLNAGSSPTATATDGVWHAVQAVYSGASSAAQVDSTLTSGLSAGTNGASGALGVGLATIIANFDGSLTETGLWATAFNSTQSGNMNTNQHGSNGYNF
jgi:hypothetical protein